MLKDPNVSPFHIDDRPGSESKANEEFVSMNPKSQFLCQCSSSLRLGLEDTK